MSVSIIIIRRHLTLMSDRREAPIDDQDGGWRREVLLLRVPSTSQKKGAQLRNHLIHTEVLSNPILISDVELIALTSSGEQLKK